MPVIETKGAVSSQGVGQFARASGPAVSYIEDVFSTWLYTGNSSTQTISNGIDLSTKGGLVWIKGRSVVASNSLFDTARGIYNEIFSDSLNAQNTNPATLTAFNSNGFSVSSQGRVNQNTDTYVSWTFRKQPKFFDVVTYTGNGAAGRDITHNLGAVPGCIIVKNVDSASDWFVYHRGQNGGVNAQNYWLKLELTDAEALEGVWGYTAPTSTAFRVAAASVLTNVNGANYVAYLFAHDAGGFGLSGTDNVISCGSFTTDSSSNATVTLGWEPQFVMLKSASAAGNWIIVDSMRGIPTGGATDRQLYPNLTNVETAGATLDLSATGFNVVDSLAASTRFVYVAIRRGPMKVPTSGTSVFNALARTGTGATAAITSPDFAADSVWIKARGIPYGWHNWEKLRGVSAGDLTFNSTGGELGSSFDTFSSFTNTGYVLGPDTASGQVNGSGLTTVNYALLRAPGFFDVVCYTGTGAALSLSHNLGVAPELIICKNRNGTPTVTNWMVASLARSSTLQSVARLNTSDAFFLNNAYFNAAPSATTFPVDVLLSASSVNYIAYLFASCPGVSKVGTYSGTGTTLQINCGFTGGARFVMIKRTDSTGDWYVWDSARGIVAGNDPYLLLNSTAAEVTNTDFIDTLSVGFEISSTAPAAINANGGSFIYLAIA